MTQVALASGFASVRRFNAAFVDALRPQSERAAARRRGSRRRASGQPVDGAAGLPAALRRARRCWASSRAAALGGVESVDGSGAASCARTLRVAQGGAAHAGWLQRRVRRAARAGCCCASSDSLAAVLPIVISRVRAMLDLDAEPMAINAALHASFPQGDGLRVPGTVDGFELAVRAVLGQQITVAAARTLAHAPGASASASRSRRRSPELDRLFPTPAALAARRAAMRWASWASCGSARRALQALAREVAWPAGCALHAGADVPATLAALQALPGIGDWTAQYIAMRALRWPDAFPAGDVALQKALGVDAARAPRPQASQAWRPWRSYAVLRAWHSPPATHRRSTRRRVTSRSIRHEIQEHHPSTAPASTARSAASRWRPPTTAWPASGSTRSATGPTRRGWHRRARRTRCCARRRRSSRDYFAGQRDALRPAARPVARHRVPAGGVAGAAAHPARARPPATARLSAGDRQAGRGARRGRGRGPQSDQRDRALPPRAGRRRLAHRLCGRAGAQDRAAATGRRML